MRKSKWTGARMKKAEVLFRLYQPKSGNDSFGACSACFVPTISIKKTDFMDMVRVLRSLSIKRTDFMDGKCKSTGIYHSLFSDSLKSLRSAWQRSRQIRKCLQSYVLTSVDGWSTPASSSKQAAQAKLYPYIGIYKKRKAASLMGDCIYNCTTSGYLQK